MDPASPGHLSLLLAELKEELVPITSTWVLTVLEALELEIQSALSSAASSRADEAGKANERRQEMELALAVMQGLRLQATQLQLDQISILENQKEALAAAGRGDWREAGLLWRALLRPKRLSSGR